MKNKCQEGLYSVFYPLTQNHEVHTASSLSSTAHPVSCYDWSVVIFLTAVSV